MSQHTQRKPAIGDNVVALFPGHANAWVHFCKALESGQHGERIVNAIRHILADLDQIPDYAGGCRDRV